MGTAGSSGQSSLSKLSNLGLAAGWAEIFSVLSTQPSYEANLDRVHPIDIKSLPKWFSFSALLSPAILSDLPIITRHGSPLHSTFVVCLALNEECRAMRRGGFYHLPVETRQLSRPCDLVFVDENCGLRSTTAWDQSDWQQRLDMFLAVKKMYAGEQVVPVCTRILKFGDLKRDGVMAKRPGSSPAPGPSQYPYSSTFDIAVKPNLYQYSRPIECLSTVLLRYNSCTSTLFVTLAGAAEDESLCVRFPTPNCLSETFVRRGISDDDVRRRANSGDRAADLVTLGGVSSHQEVILSMLQLWNDAKNRRHPDQQLFGRITYLWQEIINRSEGFDFYERFPDMVFWPRTMTM